MITVFNRAVLCREPNAEAAAKVWSALRKEKIPYEVKTKISGATKPAVRVPRTGRTGNMTASITDTTYLNGGTPASWTENAAASCVYTVFVRKKDLARAKELCEIG